MAKNRRLYLQLAGADARSHRHSTNPFADGTTLEMVSKFKKLELGGQHKLYDEAGKLAEGKLLVEYQRDGQRFAKIVHDALYGLGRLSNTARKVLDFAMYQALAGNATVWMPLDEGMVFGRFKQHKSFYDGINELVIYGYLARAEKKGFYYLNYHRYFNGNRGSLKNTFSKPKHTFTPPTDDE